MQDKKQPSLRPRIVWLVIRASGLVRWTVVFVVLYVVASLTAALCEPSVDGIQNALWLMFQVVTTIGLGDFTCTSLIGRIMVIGLSLYSVFYLALITSALVSYSQELMRTHRDESVAHFIDQLEHLPELSTEELDELSEKVRSFSARRTTP